MKRAAALIVMVAALALTTGEVASSSMAMPASTTQAPVRVQVREVVTAAPAKASNRLPSKAQWERDVAKSMRGGMKYLRQRADRRAPGVTLALNLDIDNTMLASQYDRGRPTGAVLRFVQRARELDITVLVNTARSKDKRTATKRELTEAGYVGDAAFDDICLRGKRQTGPQGKQACRARFVGDGYRLIANVGNRSTDFVGGNYDRAFKLPNYGNKIQ